MVYHQDHHLALSAVSRPPCFLSSVIKLGQPFSVDYGLLHQLSQPHLEDLREAVSPSGPHLTVLGGAGACSSFPCRQRSGQRLVASVPPAAWLRHTWSQEGGHQIDGWRGAGCSSPDWRLVSLSLAA